MSEDQKVYFETAREMFLTDGWKNFMAEIEQAIVAARIENLKDEKEFWLTKGELAALHKIFGYENMLKEAERQAEEDNESAE